VKKLVIATGNRNKKKELEEILKGLRLKVLGIPDLKIHIPRVIEDGRTFRQNAIKKALTFSRYTGEIVLADDSGLKVDALGGKPGIRSSRFARAGAEDPENIAKLLRLMKNIPKGKRAASFVCVIAIARGGDLLDTVEGKCDGSIEFIPKGKRGFGYDSVFIPDGCRKTFAEMDPSRKNKISHRARALKKARSILKKHL